MLASCAAVVHAQGINWPTNQFLPSFATPAPILDAIDTSAASNPEIDLFSSMQGIVNRTRPQVICLTSGDGEGEYTWLKLHNLSYNLTNGYNLILKYRTNFTGLVVTDTNQPDTLNLATTMAGVNNELICDPSLLATLTNAPYNLPIVDDLRSFHFSDKYALYGYLYTNYWPLCTHRIIAGMETNVDGCLRDYLVAVKSAVVWLDPGNAQDAALLGKFLTNMTANNGVYMGWWPNEGNGLSWIAQYGIPVLASDFYRNGSVFSGVPRTINIPDIPPTPPLQNKVYVALILSDGDNVQYMQHVMKMDWSGPARGSVPISWTSEALSVDLDPGLLSYYWGTVTTNDCLISGPNGAGYTHAENWSAANLAAFAKASAPYLQRSGLRVVTVWDSVNSGIAQTYATNCPTLLGLTDQSGTYSAVNLGLRTIKLTPTYASTTNQMISAITAAAAGWNGTVPIFIAAQATVWSLGPSDMRTIANSFNTNEFVFVRADHLFLMANGIFASPMALTRPVVGITPTNAMIQGTVTGNANNAVAWFEWGTNSNYGSTTTIINPGSATTNVSAVIRGLSARQTYHCRIVASNLLGVACGADRIFTTGGHLKVWGSGPNGETNTPTGLTNVVGVASGSYHGLELGSDGKVAAWGYNGFGQTNVPAGLTNVVAVAAGIKHSLALLANGTVTAWGDNSFGQTNIPSGLTNVTAVAAGGYFNLALNANQTVTAWGDDTYGQTNLPAGLTNVVGIAAGYGHALALKADGTVTAWGYDTYGQTNVPAGLDHIIAVAAGQYHSLALKANGLTSSNPIPACRWTADSLAGSNGSSVSNWMDIIAGKSAAQPVPGNQPALYSGVINGHKTVRFSGNQFLTVSAADSPVSAAGSFTLAMVFKTSTPGNSSDYFYLNTGLLGAEQPGVTTDWALCINGSQLGAGLGAGGAGGSDFSLYGGNVSDGNPHIVMYVRVGDVIRLYVDGVIVALQSGLSPEARGDFPVQIGAMAPNLYMFNGDIAEIQIYNRALTSWEIMSANENLAATYGIGGAAGTVVVWGDNANGQANVPASATNLSTVASGNAFNLALQANGTVTGWGDNSQGQTTFPTGLTNVAAISGGVNFSLAIGNQPPVASNVVVSGYVNHDLLIALPAFSPDDVPLNFRIESLPLSGALYENSDGTRGPLINTTGTLVSDAGGHVIFAPAPGETGSPDAGFNFLADDGMFNSGTAQVTVNIGLPAAPQFTGEFLDEATSDFNLNFSGSSNATYSVWSSTNLTNWINIGAAPEANPGQYEFIDIDTTNSPQKFYRISAP
ncbi:MAG TPA: LamG-like jellyroll fold domain-containing protein [Candidatus Sulfopaludibacter sp.]|nr:LamG-like jellyroll fold domain-containing protein [Candidatus Sulfopaludibacter sp.]